MMEAVSAVPRAPVCVMPPVLMYGSPLGLSANINTRQYMEAFAAIPGGSVQRKNANIIRRCHSWWQAHAQRGEPYLQLVIVSVIVNALPACRLAGRRACRAPRPGLLPDQQLAAPCWARRGKR